MKPQAGTFYVVVRGDQIRQIARSAYGYDRSADIINANSGIFTPARKAIGISLEGLPFIYKGDRLWLPEIKKQFSEKVEANTKDEISIRLDGVVFTGWTASGIERNINTVADVFSFTLPYDPTDNDLVEKTRPFSYKSAELFIGGELYISAETGKITPSGTLNATTKKVEARTKAGRTVECMAQREAVEFIDQTLSSISIKIMEPYGDDLKPLFFDGDSDKFTKVRKEVTDTDFDFLSGLAAQKGFMITSSDTGQMAFIRAAITGKPVFRIIEGDSAIEGVTASYDNSKRFSSFQAVTESAGSSGPSAIINDESIPVYRPFVFAADDLEAGNLETALQWRRSKSLADSTILTITMTGWRNENNQLWRENMKGTIKMPSVDIFTESDYIIKSVKLDKNEAGGNVAILSFVLPQAYSLEFPDSFPWEG